ncbi:unnamed protein product [Knipowitschia caucasica]|uniref:SOWAHA-C winged helix-turn-helix domain-containing protein n=1 Tax=Knipowitschia caucasica TaxID=637954 RepID=A0AAV2LCF6_KNICA
MAVECTQKCILNYLYGKGGQVPNAEFVEHFKSIFPSDSKRKAETRELFKRYVDSVAFVKTHNGVKYVCLRKKFSLTKQEPSHQHKDRGQVNGRDVQVATGVRSSSDYSHDGVPHVLDTLQEEQAQSDCNTGVECSGADAMGNRGSVKRLSKREQKVVEIPVITLIQPSPLSVQESVFNLPEPDEKVNTEKGETRLSQSRRFSTPSLQLQREEDQTQLEDSRKCSDDGDAQSLTGSEGTPKTSRKNFIEVMMSSSPQVRRNISLRTSSISRSDSDSASIASGVLDDDRAPVALDPLEHEWMMCASDAQWGSLQALLNTDPGLVLKKDFVTGFTCLHWAAKQNKPELIALIVNFAKQNRVCMSVNVRSSTGYTPLHIAAMHNHMDVVKLLVGAYNADVEIRDYSGRKACQYLTDNASVDLRDIIGAYEVETENKPEAVGKRWTFTKALQMKPKALHRLNSAGDSDTPDGGARESPLRRRASLSRVKPKLQKLRWRTSQLVHSTTFHGVEDLEKRRGARPKTHFFT